MIRTEDIKVSVIIPIYNTEQYVEEAVNSILAQTHQNIEVITVDDGSTDGTLAILENISLRDNRVIVISKPNGGQGSARNLGFDRATGDYIYFMDSDDLLEVDAFSLCIEKSINTGAEIIFFNAEIFSDSSNVFPEDAYNVTQYIDEHRLYNGYEVIDILVHENCGFRVAEWLNFISATYLKKIALRQHEGMTHEDELFTTLMYLQAENVTCIHRSFFRRRVRDNSTMTSSFRMHNIEGYFTAADQLLLFVRDKDENIVRAAEAFVVRMLNAALCRSFVLPFKNRVYVAKIAFSKFRRYITFRSYVVLFVKKIINR